MKLSRFFIHWQSFFDAIKAQKLFRPEIDLSKWQRDPNLGKLNDKTVVSFNAERALML